MSKPTLPAILHFKLDGALDAILRESFARNGQVYAGVQWTSWQGDEAGWNFRLGRYRGPGFMRAVPRDLDIWGALLTTDADGALCRVMEGEPLTVTCGVNYGEPDMGGNLEIRLYRASDGPLQASTLGMVLSRFPSNGTLGVVPPGSYVLWARFAGVTTAPITEAQYTALVGHSPSPEYFYEETVDGTEERFFYDALRNIGRLPADPAHELYRLRAFVVAQNLQKDDPTRAGLVTSGTVNDGEWAAIRVRVGNGAWSRGANVSAAPGCPLYVKDIGLPEVLLDAESESSHRVAFDPLARTVSASCVLHSDILKFDGSIDIPAGAQIIAGLRASRSGPQSALWQLHDDNTARLLATHTTYSSGICECGKSDHHASDVGQSPEGSLYLLTECSLHRYEPYEPDIELKLPGAPAQTEGHPGGQCLRFYEGKSFYSTELLVAPPADNGTYYYNRVVIRIGGGDVVGPGTVWHGPNFAEIYLNKWWSVRQPLPYSDPDSVQMIDFLENGQWFGQARGHAIARPSSTHRWRQLRRRGKFLFVFGYRPGALDNGQDDTPIAGAMDGAVFQEVEFPYFVRRATLCKRNFSGVSRESLFVTCSGEDEGNGVARRVVELPPGLRDLEGPADGHTGEGAPGGPPRNAQEAIDQMPAGTKFRHIRRGAPDVALPVCAMEISDLSNDRKLRAAALDWPFLLWLRHDSSAPFEDLSTYDQPARFGIQEMLDEPASQSADAVVLVPPDAQPVELIALQRRI